MAIITTPTPKQLDFAKHMLEISSITTVGYGDPMQANEVQSILEDIRHASGVTLHIGSVPPKAAQNVEAPLLPVTLPNKSQDNGRGK
jgi:hypothetical protein